MSSVCGCGLGGVYHPALTFSTGNTVSDNSHNLTCIYKCAHMQFSRYGYKSVVEYLVKNRSVNLTYKESDGSTVLHLACR